MTAGLHRQGNGGTLLKHGITGVVSVIASLALAYFGHFGATGTQGPAGPAGKSTVTISKCIYVSHGLHEADPQPNGTCARGIPVSVAVGK